MTARQIALHAGLFLLTCGTTTLAGGVSFSLPLMTILMSHEMGHFVVARRYGVLASLPYFIPLPPQFGIGTMGAVIRMPQVHSRNALIAIGAAGPLAGLCVAIPVLGYGLMTSPVRAVLPGGMLEGNSLLYFGMKLVLLGEVLPGNGRDVYLNGTALAGWVGLLVTFINLIPIGQLDGGHVAFGYYGLRHNLVSGLLHRALLPIGVGVMFYVMWDARRAGALNPWAHGFQASLNWFVWMLLLPLMRRATGGLWHPPIDDEPLSPACRNLARAMLIVFLLIFVPIPWRISLQ